MRLADIPKLVTLGLVLTVMACKTSSMLGLGPTPALAQTSTERRACRHDAERFCKYALKGNAFTVVSCLAANKGKITIRCSEVLKARGL